MNKIKFIVAKFMGELKFANIDRQVRNNSAFETVGSICSKNNHAER